MKLSPWSATVASSGRINSEKDFHSAYTPVLKRYARQLVSLPDDIDDLVQRTWVKVYLNRGSYRGGSLATWIKTILRNEYFDHLRFASKRERAEYGFAQQILDNEPLQPAVTRESMPVEGLILDTILHLPRRDRTMFILGVFGKYPKERIAQIEKCSIRTVTLAIRSARRRIYETLRSSGTIVIHSRTSDTRRPGRNGIGRKRTV